MLKLATETMYRLVDFAVAKGLISPIDRPYCLNRLLEVMQLVRPGENRLSARRNPRNGHPLSGYPGRMRLQAGHYRPERRKQRSVPHQGDGRSDPFPGGGAL